MIESIYRAIPETTSDIVLTSAVWESKGPISKNKAQRQKRRPNKLTLFFSHMQHYFISFTHR